MQDGLGSIRRVEKYMWNSQQMTEIAKKCDIVLDLLLSWLYSDFGQLRPHRTAAECRYRMDGVKSVYGKAMSAFGRSISGCVDGPARDDDDELYSARR